jgi:predicted DNA-binding protein
VVSRQSATAHLAGAKATLAGVGEDAADRSERRLASGRLRAELQERIDELARRRKETDAYIGEARGSGAEQVRIAREILQRARRAAGVAAEQAAVAHEAAAHAHERAAALHERIADLGGGDRDDHLRRAADHRRAACKDREAAVADRSAADTGHQPSIRRDDEP